VRGSQSTTTTSGNRNLLPMGFFFLFLPPLLRFPMPNSNKVLWGLDPEGLEHMIRMSPAKFLEDSLLFAYGFRPHDVISSALHGVHIDLCTKEASVM
jgi:hypothetical protein